MDWSRWSLSFLCNVLMLWTGHASSWDADLQHTLACAILHCIYAYYCSHTLKREAQVANVFTFIFSYWSRRATCRPSIGENQIIIWHLPFQLCYWIQTYNVSRLFHQWILFFYFFVIKQVDRDLGRGYAWKSSPFCRSECYKWVHPLPGRMINKQYKTKAFPWWRSRELIVGLSEF